MATCLLQTLPVPTYMSQTKVKTQSELVGTRLCHVKLLKLTGWSGSARRRLSLNLLLYNKIYSETTNLIGQPYNRDYKMQSHGKNYKQKQISHDTQRWRNTQNFSLPPRVKDESLFSS